MCTSCTCPQQWDISCGWCDSDHCLPFSSTGGFPASALLSITNVVWEARWCLLTWSCCCTCVDKRGFCPYCTLSKWCQQNPTHVPWNKNGLCSCTNQCGEQGGLYTITNTPFLHMPSFQYLYKKPLWGGWLEVIRMVLHLDFVCFCLNQNKYLKCWSWQ